MLDSLYIAWKYISFYRLRTLTLIACVSLIAILPLSLEVMLNETERQLLSRANSTPLLLGARGSALDLVMNSLYFDDEVPELINMTTAETIDESGSAYPIPLYVRFRARGFPVVGTTLDYFDFRDLKIAEGRQMALLGECVIGADVAEKLELSAGDSLLTSPEALFDLAGVYPLKMKIAGVLERSFTPDDNAVLVDVKTAWVIQGLVHGHEDVSALTDSTVIMQRDADNIVASAKLVEYNEITPQNINRFHFHGSPDDYPLSAVIVVPDDERAGTILRGRYLDTDNPYQLAQPADVIDGLLANIFRIKDVLDAVVLFVGIATLLALVLVFSLSVRLRKREIDTVFQIGGSRSTIARLLMSEIAIILLASALLCGGVLLLVQENSDQLVRALIIS
jgi:putative ABC transport system permease protein